MKKIILIDDDSTSNYLSGLIINSVSPDCEIISFTDPVDVFAEINNLKIDKDTILLLDIEMPNMNGWEFLSRFENIGLDCSCFILTSASIILEKENAKNFSAVKQLFKKPLTQKDAQKILNEN